MKAKEVISTKSRPTKRVQFVFTKPSKTKQSFKDECDINLVMKKFEKEGQLPSMIKENPKYGDFSSPLDYQESLNTVIHANEQFAALPSSIRQRFSNDPQQFLEFAVNPKNGEELVNLGLATKRDLPQGSGPQNVKKAQKQAKPETSGKTVENEV